MKKALAFLIMSFCLSCGIKGPPLPPLDENVARKQKAESVTVSTAAAPSSSDATSATSPVKMKKPKK